ncbi:hypothetical protein ACFSFZ_20795 [Mixta tenebrionis]|uniref:Uncharacterized protein n=1 Tax=Mixta tenebrionis TaxID=2562439 RepID=A0A506V634_9GAMM|nr:MULTISPECIES: hypothetical protein [Mixta]QHM78027.1 hypothetical protein C7M52_04058 [Mixta theicola]TPW41006.1 hypothetical protein FKM52_16055 [Mixta tenebrionis]
MKELNAKEIAAVSGAGVLGIIGGTFAGIWGGIYDSITGLLGQNNHTSEAASLIGEGIGLLFELNFSGGVEALRKGCEKLFS